MKQVVTPQELIKAGFHQIRGIPCMAGKFGIDPLTKREVAVLYEVRNHRFEFLYYGLKKYVEDFFRDPEDRKQKRYKVR